LRKLITANQAFAAALKQALLKGAETSVGVLAEAPQEQHSGFVSVASNCVGVEGPSGGMTLSVSCVAL
jgi:hypothetical protein